MRKNRITVLAIRHPYAGPRNPTPDYIRNMIISSVGENKIAFGVGNIINLYSVIEETLKDGVKQIDS